MTVIGEIDIRKPEFIEIAEEKVRSLCIVLSLSAFVTDRLVALTADLSRLFRMKRIPLHLRIDLDRKTPDNEFVFLIQGRGILPVRRTRKVKSLCDGMKTIDRTLSSGTAEAKQLEPYFRRAVALDESTGLSNNSEQHGLMERLCSEIREKDAEIKKHARRSKRREKELMELRQRSRKMAAKLALAEERERKRLAMGLHDSVVQWLTATLLRADLLEDMLPAGEAKNQVYSIRDEVKTSMQALRRLSFELSPPILYEFGLGASLEWLGAQVQKQGISFDFPIREEAPELHESAKVLLYQCVRELVANVRKHADASRLVISQTVDGTCITLTISDDGKGFDPTIVARHSKRNSSFGLLSVRDRVAQLGGRLDLLSKPGVGTTATLTAPLNAMVGA